MAEYNYRIKNRRDTAYNWSENNPTPLVGELCIETDTNKFKFGDGVTDWNSLSYVGTYADEVSTLIETYLDGYYTQDEVDLIVEQLNELIASKADTEDIPTVNNGTVSIYQGSTLKGSFTLNQSGDCTVTLDDGGITSVSWDDISNKPTFADVATTGSYDDLTDKPDLTEYAKTTDVPTVYDSTISIYQGETLKGTFTLNQSGNYTVTLDESGLTTVDWSDVQNKPNFADVATSGSYNDLTDTPTIPTKTSDLTNDSDFATTSDIPTVNDGTVTIVQGTETKGTFTLNQSGDTTITLSEGTVNTVDWENVENKPNFATVATSGSYNDLSDTPTIPTATSDLTNDSGYITSSSLPTKTSDLTNDSGYITVDEIPSQTDNNFTNADKNKLDTIANGAEVNVQSDWNVTDTTSDAYIANKPDVYTKTETNTLLSAKADTSDIPTNTSDLTNDSGFITANDIPAIPTKTSDLVNDSNFATTSDIPTVNDNTITIVQGGTTKGSFTLNQNSDATITIDEGGVTTVDWSDVENKPTFATVSTSGSYNDLTDTPTIGDATVTVMVNEGQINTFTLNQTTDVSIDIPVPENTSDLTNDSGYITSSDLPTVNDGTLTIQKNGTNVGTFTANSSTNSTVNITVPTDETDLGLISETWTFTLEDDTTVTKTVVLK